MSVETIKMFEKGMKVDFHLTINPRLRQEQPFCGVVVNYPRGQFTQKILAKNNRVVEIPVILVRVRTVEMGEFVVDARGVKATKATEGDLQQLRNCFGK